MQEYKEHQSGTSDAAGKPNVHVGHHPIWRHCTAGQSLCKRSLGRGPPPYAGSAQAMAGKPAA